MGCLVETHFFAAHIPVIPSDHRCEPGTSTDLVVSISFMFNRILVPCKLPSVELQTNAKRLSTGIKPVQQSALKAMSRNSHQILHGSEIGDFPSVSKGEKGVRKADGVANAQLSRKPPDLGPEWPRSPPRQQPHQEPLECLL